MNKTLKKYIEKQVKKIYPVQKLGDCYEINSTVAYYLFDLGYKVQISQGRVKLDRPIYDEILKLNRPETKGITQNADHAWIKLYKKNIRKNYDFANKVFGKAKILSYSRTLDTLYGKENSRLFKLLKGKGNEN